MQVKGRFSKESFDLAEKIETLNQQGDLLYINYFNDSFYQLHASFNRSSSESDSLGNQDINEWQLDGLYSKRISKLFNLEVQDIYLSRDFSILNTQYHKNRLQLSFNYRLPENKIFGLGFFWDKMFLDNPDTSASRDLYGFQVEYHLKNLIIFNILYSYDFLPASSYNSHQLNCVMGKYLSKKWSLFIALFYTWIDDSEGDLRLFNHLEAFNNINLKLACDIFENTNIYLKGILEDHKLVSYQRKITSTQFVLGIQQKI